MSNVKLQAAGARNGLRPRSCRRGHFPFDGSPEALIHEEHEGPRSQTKRFAAVVPVRLLKFGATSEVLCGSQ